MLTLEELNARYEASVDLLKYGTEIQVAHDPAGQAVDRYFRQIVRTTADGYGEDWQRFISLARLFRWRLLYNPAFPPRDDPDSILMEIASELGYLRPRIDENQELLATRFLEAAKSASEGVNPVGELLLQSLDELGALDVTVLVATSRIVQHVSAWLSESEMAAAVSVAGAGAPHVFEQAYVIGQPSRFPARVVTSPIARSVAFLIPDWAHNRELPTSAFSAHASGAIRPKSRVFEAPDAKGGDDDYQDEFPEVELWPTISWSRAETEGPARDPDVDETLARKYLLANSLAIFLEDDGDLVRRFYPGRPPGERVELGGVSTLGVGDFLVLRSDTEERESLYTDAIEMLGKRGVVALASQREWKALLHRKLSTRGLTHAIDDLRGVGAKYPQRVAAWVNPDVSRPRLADDFALLLGWLGLPVEPHLQLAGEILKARMRVGHRIRKELEQGLAMSNLEDLQSNGFLRMDFEVSGRSMFVARVIGISPQPQVVARRETRIPFSDRTATWLE